MSRAFLPVLFLLASAGCQLPPEQVPIKPLPENGPPETYADLIGRARLQTTAANEAFYVNRWGDLEDAAKGMEQTASHLSKATEVPAKHKDTLPVEAGELGRDAVKLRDAAKAQDVKLATESLQRLNLKVRELRPEE
jgi:hypothetical protein